MNEHRRSSFGERLSVTMEIVRILNKITYETFIAP